MFARAAGEKVKDHRSGAGGDERDQQDEKRGMMLEILHLGTCTRANRTHRM